MYDPKSTRTGWTLIMAGLALLVVAMILSVILPGPWGYLIGSILGVPAGISIALGINQRWMALDYRREMRDLADWYRSVR